MFAVLSQVGGAHGLQAASGAEVIAERAFAPSAVPGVCLIDGAPYTQAALAQIEEALERPSAVDVSVGDGASTASASLTDAEAACVRRIDAILDDLHARGLPVGGIVVEVRSNNPTELKISPSGPCQSRSP
jgi:hypothetical protein